MGEIIVLVAGYILLQMVADITAVKMTGPVLGQFITAGTYIYPGLQDSADKEN